MTPAVRTGCDVVDVARLSAAIDRRDGFLERVFTAGERADALRGGVASGSPTQRARLAARFAAKEATRKALGDLRLPFHAVEVRTTADGAPHLYVGGHASELSVSLSHDAGIAIAVVAGVVRRSDSHRDPDTVRVAAGARVALDLARDLALDLDLDPA